MSRPVTVCEAFQRTCQQRPDAVALRGGGRVITWREYGQTVERLASAMACLGVGHGDAVALMLPNQPEFHFLDTAAMHLGATPFSIYNTSSPEQIAHVMRNSGARVIFCAPEFLSRVTASGVPVRAIGTDLLDTLEPLPGFDFEAAWRAVTPADVLTLIYTSGTTGPAKGVELTHANLLAQAGAVAAVFDLRDGDRITSYLPSAHIADRLSCHYLQMLYAAEVTCVPDPRQLITTLPEVRPTIWVAVPRVWEKMKARIDEAVANANPLRRQLFHWAMRQTMAQRPVRGWLADKGVLYRVRRKMGLEQLRWALSGSAPIAPETLMFFQALGVRVCEIWGMSETCGIGTANPPGRVRVGTVGLAIPGAEIRLADDGELLIRGPMVMRGYRGDPQRTAEAVDADGWLRTGDVAVFGDDGYLSIVDRKKELIINTAGKNMSPSNIENTVKVTCPQIAAIVVVGDRRPFNVALICLDPDAVGGRTREEIESLVAQGIKAANARLSRVEQIKRYQILPGAWEPGGEELTPTLKLRRQAIHTKYAIEIEALYA